MLQRELWIKCLGDTQTVKTEVIDAVMGIAPDYLGDYLIIAYAESEQSMRKFTNLPRLNKEAVPILEQQFGEGNVKVIEREVQDSIKSVKKTNSRNRTNELLERIAVALERIEGHLRDDR